LLKVLLLIIEGYAEESTGKIRRVNYRRGEKILTPSVPLSRTARSAVLERGRPESCKME
jgi:hypothetical protein